MRYFLICIFLSGMFSEAISSEKSDIDYADSLYNTGNYFEAAIEYERTFYYSKDVQIKNQSLYRKALCYKRLGNYQESFRSLERISYFGVSPEKRDLYQYESALMAYLVDEYVKCNKYLVLLSSAELDSAMQVNIFLLGALNSVMIKDFDQSRNYSKKYISSVNFGNELDTVRLSVLFSKKNLPKLKNEKTLFWVGLVPGFGQIYAGKPGEGITNSLMNAAVFTFGVYQMINGFYFTGYFVGALSINKLYFGGRSRAEYILKVRNQEKLKSFHNRLNDYLLSLNE